MQYLSCGDRAVTTTSAIKYHHSPSFTPSSQKHMPHICVLATTSETWL